MNIEQNYTNFYTFQMKGIDEQKLSRAFIWFNFEGLTYTIDIVNVLWCSYKRKIIL